ncbi:MAG: hypothetical protein JWL62_191 [Hyphomicrobiales bacterium]|nr:hypothetical protein [Hyphomicrobiales bacterium]
MMLRLAAGLWICLVALASSYGMTMWKVRQSTMPTGPAHESRVAELRKLKVINVPMISNGAVQGYVVTQISYTLDAEMAKKLSISPDSFVLDEAFRLIYSDEKLDFRHLDRFNLAQFRASIREGVKGRLQADVVLDVLVPEFTFIASEDIRK